MSGIVIFLITLLAIAICAIADEIRIKKPKETERKPVAHVSDFSPSDYMGRIEKTAVEIMQEAQKRPKYQLVLWAGLDGLRLNEDGTSEWIRREEEKQKAVSVSYSPPQSVAWTPAFNCNQMQNVSCETQNRISQLQAQLQNLQFQQWQTQQMQSMSAYTPYYQPTYYSAVTQCCVRQ